MTAMDTQSTRDARGAGSGENATGFQRSDVSEQPLPSRSSKPLDSGLRRNDEGFNRFLMWRRGNYRSICLSVAKVDPYQPTSMASVLY